MQINILRGSFARACVPVWIQLQTPSQSALPLAQCGLIIPCSVTRISADICHFFQPGVWYQITHWPTSRGLWLYWCECVQLEIMMRIKKQMLKCNELPYHLVMVRERDDGFFPYTEWKLWCLINASIMWDIIFFLHFPGVTKWFSGLWESSTALIRNPVVALS